MTPSAISAACSRSWRRCARPRPAARGISSRISRPSRPIRSKRPMRSPTPSRATISPISRRNWAISCCKWSFTRAWPKNKARSISATWSRRSPQSSSAGIRMCSATSVANPASRRGFVGAHQGAREASEGRARRREHAGALAGVPVGLPALTRALKLQAKASKVGFDWNDPRAVLHKIREEADEIEAALDGDAADAGSRSRRSAVRRRQSRASSARRPGSGAAADQPEIRTPLRRDRAGARCRRKAAGRHARRNGRAVGRGQGAGTILHSGGAKVLQIDKLLRRRQRRLDGAALAHEGDDLGEPPRSISACRGSTPRSGSR